MKLWRDITQDPKTAHYVSKDLYKALAFFGGLFSLLVLLPAVLIVARIALPEGPGIFMLTGALGFQFLKEGSNYLNRRTADDYGNPLAQPGTAEPPADPKLMPQSE